VEQSQSGGKVGYRSSGGDSGQLILAQRIKETAEKICVGNEWKILNDRLMSQQHLSSGVVSHTDYIGGMIRGETLQETQAKTTYHAQSYTYNAYWREAQIECQANKLQFSESDYTQSRVRAISYAEIDRGDWEAECNKGKVNSCYDLAISLLGTEQKAEATKILTIACNRKMALSCSIIFELSGQKEKAFNMYVKSCRGGDLRGCAHAGALKFSEKKIAEATLWASKACNGGHKNSCAVILWEEYNEGGARNKFSEVESLCNAENEAIACRLLAKINYDNRNIADYRAYAEKACKLGDTLGCMHVLKNTGH